MRSLVFLIVLVAGAVAGVGMYQGWFKVEKVNDGKNTTVNIKVDNAGFTQAKEDFLKLAQEKLRGLSDEVDKMRTDAPTDSSRTATAPGAAPPEKGLPNTAGDDLRRLKGEAERSLEALKSATAENYEALKKEADAALEKLRAAAANARAGKAK